MTIAVEEVFEAASDDLIFLNGIVMGHPDAVNRVRDRARVDSRKGSPFSYVDRFGTLHLAFDETVELARAFCAAEPSTVLTYIEGTERKWSLEAGQPGKEHLVRLLNEYRAGWAILRQWAGYDAAIAQREAHIQRLERLVWDAVYALQKAGLDSEAHRLRRALERP